MTESFQSALFPGHVTHARLRPKVHKLAYKIYSLLLDLDELEALDRKLKLFSLDRFNLFSFYRKDRGDGSALPLREQVERAMEAAGICLMAVRSACSLCRVLRAGHLTRSVFSSAIIVAVSLWQSFGKLITLSASATAI